MFIIFLCLIFPLACLVQFDESGDIFHNAHFACNEILRDARYASSRAFGRGLHKEAYVVALRNQTFVAKVPLYNAQSSGRFNATTARLLPSAAVASRDKMFREFRKHIAEEVTAANNFTHGHADQPNQFIAQYLGGCVGAALGATQVVVQEGPFLILSALLSRAPAAAADAPSSPPPTLAWYARMEVAINALRLLEHLRARHLLHCSWGAHQLGVDAWLRVRMFDLGHIVPHRAGVDAPVGAERPCQRHSQCSGHAIHCMSASHALADLRCDTRRAQCIGVDMLSASQDAAMHILRPLLLRAAAAAAADAPPPPVAVLDAVRDAIAGASHVDRAARWPVRRVLDALRDAQRAAGGDALLVAARGSVHAQVQRLIDAHLDVGRRQCTRSLQC